MARITPSTGTFDPESFVDYEPYRVQLKTIAFSESSPQYGSEKRLELTWDMEDGQDLRDWVGLRLGKQQSGQVSKLRMLLNALSEKPEATEVAWFDDETLEWSYTKDGAPFRKLGAGVEVVVRGKVTDKADGSGRRFQVTAYQPLKAVKGAKPNGQVAKAAAGKVAPADDVATDVDPDEIPF